MGGSCDADGFLGVGGWCGDKSRSRLLRDAHHAGNLASRLEVRGFGNRSTMPEPQASDLHTKWHPLFGRGVSVEAVVMIAGPTTAM